METVIRKSMIEMSALLLCRDVQFLGTTRRVLKQLAFDTTVDDSVSSALVRLQTEEFDSLIVDWRELDNMGDFLDAIRKANATRHCRVVAIVRDLLDLRQAFAAGVHFLIQKPASMVQIERTLRAVRSSFAAERRKAHREAVQIGASLTSKNMAHVHVTVRNIGEGGVGLKLNTMGPNRLSAGDAVEMSFLLPETTLLIHASGVIAWTNPEGAAGVEFRFIPEVERRSFERWMAERLERSLAEQQQQASTGALSA